MTAARLSPQREAAEGAVTSLVNGGYTQQIAREIVSRVRAEVRAEAEAELAAVRAERDEARAQSSAVAEFVAKRAEYIAAINNCHPNNRHDYLRWQGHAESRRQLAQQLGLPVAWPADYEQGATS